ncbi:hypothetical protein [Ignatzschineria indica]|nr:hypothetical protein [Ignatzschineria indica]
MVVSRGSMNFLKNDSLRQQKLNAAGSHHRILPKITRRQSVIFYRRKNN